MLRLVVAPPSSVMMVALDEVVGVAAAVAAVVPAAARVVAVLSATTSAITTAIAGFVGLFRAFYELESR